jgi:5-methylcytosine-specific restriction protein A
MMRVCLTWRCPNKIPIAPGRKTPSRCAECRGRSWSNPPPANSYAYGYGWQVIRKRVLVRDHYQCQLRYADICVGRASQVDHIVQPEAGGTNDLSNLRAVCVKCHRRRTGQQGALEKQRRSKHLRSRKEK